MQETQGEKLREHRDSRDFICVIRDAFRIFARQSSIILGSAWAFSAAILIIVTFLIVFLIQNTQNRDAKAFQLKLDEIIRALKDARNELVDLENLSDEDLKILEQQFQRIRQKAEHDGSHPRNVASARRIEESE